MPPTNQQLGTFLRESREAADLSLRELADRAGVDYAVIHRLEHGERSPRAETLQALAPHLGVKIEDLFALAGFATPRGLPSLRPYLRASYSDVPAEVVDAFAAEIEQKFNKLRQGPGEKGGRHGKKRSNPTP